MKFHHFSTLSNYKECIHALEEANRIFESQQAYKSINLQHFGRFVDQMFEIKGICHLLKDEFTMALDTCEKRSEIVSKLSPSIPINEPLIWKQDESIYLAASNSFSETVQMCRDASKFAHFGMNPILGDQNVYLRKSADLYMKILNNSPKNVSVIERIFVILGRLNDDEGFYRFAKPYIEKYVNNDIDGLPTTVLEIMFPKLLENQAFLTSENVRRDLAEMSKWEKRMTTWIHFHFHAKLLTATIRLLPKDDAGKAVDYANQARSIYWSVRYLYGEVETMLCLASHLTAQLNEGTNMNFDEFLVRVMADTHELENEDDRIRFQVELAQIRELQKSRVHQ
jgi:tetratricopeptide (TPR) repeat protein